MNENRTAISRFQVANGRGDTINGEIRFSVHARELPVIVICHSFMAFKEWGFFPFASAWLAGRGFAVLTFNFSLNGVEGDDNRITRFDRFASNTFTRELEDLDRIIDGITDASLGNGICDPARIGLVGHSRGGGIAIVHAAGDRRVRALATWSSIATFDRWSPHQKSSWREKGFLPLANNSTVSPLRLGIGLLDDLELHADRLDIGMAAAKVEIPWLIVHGREDVTVKVREAEFLRDRSVQSFSKLVILDHVGHLYNAATEKEDRYATFMKILTLTSDWFHQHFTFNIRSH